MIDLTGKPKAAMLGNVNATLEAVDRLKNRKAHLPGLGVIHGPSGYGKTVAATVATTEHRAAYVECRSTWTRKTFLEAVCRELGIREPQKSLAGMVEEAGFELATSGRPLIVDEADILVDRGMIETLRELHMVSEAPVIMFGEEALPAKLRRHERVHNRVLEWVPAAPATLQDARALAELYLSLTIADDLLAVVVEKAAGRIRRIVVNLDAIETEALREGVEQPGLKWWGNRPLYTGEAPRRTLAQ